MKHLKERQEYVDRYDKITVENCRWHENFHLNYAQSQTDKSEKEQQLIQGISNWAWEIEKIFITLRWHDDKEATIQKWMDSDRRKNELLENARTPENIFCDECFSRMHLGDKYLRDLDEDNRVLFFFDCPNSCKKRKALYGDGEQYIPKPHLCEKCKSETEVTRERVTDKQIQTTYTCSGCGFQEEDIFELSSSEKEEDPKYEYDRNRFCLSGEELRKAQESRRNLENLGELVKKFKHKEDNKDLYDKVSKPTKLTIPKLKDVIRETLEKEKYLNITFEKPELGHIVWIEFSAEEMQTDNERASVQKLAKIIKETLKETNWRLMSSGISYRLGVLSGRLRVYEKEEDLIRLV